MPRTYRTYERAPHVPYKCINCNATASTDNVLIDIDKQIDFYGMVYLCYRCVVGITNQLGFVTPQVSAGLMKENERLTAQLKRVPKVTERLINDIRDLSLSASAELLSDPTSVVLANDPIVEPSNTGVNADYFGDDTPAEPSSEPVVDKGSDSVPADSGSKRTTKTSPRTSTTSNR